MDRNAEGLAIERDAEVPAGGRASDRADQPQIGSREHAVDERAPGPPGRAGNAYGSHWREQVLNIIVVDDEHAEDATRFAYKERVSAPLLQDPHFREQLIQRVAWAVADAEQEGAER